MLICRNSIVSVCPNPDAPLANSMITSDPPITAPYLLGESVTYECNDNLVRFNNDGVSTCQQVMGGEPEWSRSASGGELPICCKYVKVINKKYPVGKRRYTSASLSFIDIRLNFHNAISNYANR